MKIERIETTEAFRDLRPEWERLLSAAPQASVFLTWEWLFTWWTHFQGAKKLYLLCVRDDATSQLLAIAPWYLEKSRLFPGLSVRKISFLGTGLATSDFLDLIIVPGQEAPVLACLGRYLQTHGRDWDVVEFNDISENSPILDYLRKNKPPSFGQLERTTGICPYIPLPPDYSLYYSTLSSKWRRYLKTHTQTVETELQMGYTLAADPERLAENVDCLFKLHAERFGAKNTNQAKGSNFSGARLRDFHCDLAARFLARGWLQLYFLEHQQEPVGCLYAFRYQDRLFAYQTGFSCAWQKHGLGNVLFNHAIRESIQAGLKEFHFLRGDEAYKTKWTATAMMLRTLTWTNANITGRLYAACFQVKAKLKPVLMSLGLRRTPDAPPSAASRPTATE
jgi:CelD/BcsL family acetyltransferase involved in cellulose biosynthesis